MILLHGLGSTWNSWRPLLPLLEAEFTVFAPTLPGHWGAAAMRPIGEASVNALVDEVELWMDHFGLARAHAVGHSLGGWAVLELARRGRCDTVVLLSPAGGWVDERARADLVGTLTTARLATWLAQPAIDTAMVLPWTRRLGMSLMLVHANRVRRQAAVEELLSVARAPGFNAALRALASASPFGPWHDHEPIHVVLGERDLLLPPDRYGYPLLERIAPTEHVVLSGAGHLIHWDEPNLVADRIVTALRTGSMTAPGHAIGTVALREAPRWHGGIEAG